MLCGCCFPCWRRGDSGSSLVKQTRCLRHPAQQAFPFREKLTAGTDAWGVGVGVGSSSWEPADLTLRPGWMGDPKLFPP